MLRALLRQRGGCGPAWFKFYKFREEKSLALKLKITNSIPGQFFFYGGMV
jgi:hypothetical protein